MAELKPTNEYKDKSRYAKAYEEGKYSQPTSTKPEDRQDPKFFLDWCNFVYSCYSYGSTQNINGGYSRTGRSIGELRAYGRGMQNPDKYKAWCDVLVDVGARTAGNGGVMPTKQSIMNISWDLAMPLQPMRDIALSKLNAPKYEPIVRATDTIADNIRREKYYKDKLAVDPRMKALFAQVGKAPEGVNPNYAGMDSTDVEVMQQLGGYALPVEVLMQDVVSASLDKSNFEDINTMLNSDLFDINMMAVHVKALPGQGRIGVEYVDPVGLVMPVSAYNDCRDIPYVGKVAHTTISQLRQECPELTEKEIYLIAKSYSGYGRNTAIRAQFPDFTNIGWRQEYKNQNGNMPYDNFSICVMELYFVCNDTENYIVGARKNGAQIFDRVGSDSSLNPGDIKNGKSMYSTAVQYVYKCKWVVGSEHVFGYGLDDTIVRVGEDGSKQAMLPIPVWIGDGPSIVERCISTIDDIQLATLKIRALFASLPPSPRIFIDYSLLQESFQMGSVTIDPLTQLSIFAGKGVLLGKSKSEFADPNMQGSNRPPITPLQIGAQEDFNLFSIDIQRNMAALRQLTGVNEVADGTAAGQDLLIGTAQMLDAASNNSLKPYLSAGYSLFKRTVTCVAKKYQLLALDGTINMKYWPVGGNTIKTLELTPDIALYNMEVEARLLPTEQEIQLMTQMLIQKQTEGKLTSVDVFIVIEMLNQRDTKKAKVYMAKAIAKNEARIMQEQQMMMQQQNEGNAMVARAGEEARANTAAMEGEIKSKNMILKHQLDMEKMKEQSRLRREEIATQAVVDAAAEPAAM